MCEHKWTGWKHWKNEFPSMFQSLENEIRECKKCGCIQFKYKPEGKENRPEWSKEQIEDMDSMIKVVYSNV